MKDSAFTDSAAKGRAMAHPRRLLVVGALAIALLAGCDDKDGGVTITGQDGSSIEVSTATASATTSPETSATTSEATPAGATATASSTATPTTTTPTPTSTPIASPTSSGGGATSAGDTSGFPYSTSDVRAAMEAADVGFEVDDEQEPLCGDTSVPETAFNAGGSSWALWVYPDSAARESEWVLEDGQLTPQVGDCAPPTGFNYFNANLVLVLTGPGGAQAEVVRDAFLAVGSAGSEDD